MKACLDCGDTFEPGPGPTRLSLWYCPVCAEQGARWKNMKDTALRLQAEERQALASYRPQSLVSGQFFTPTHGAVMILEASPLDRPALPTPMTSGHGEVSRVGLGGGAGLRL